MIFYDCNTAPSPRRVRMFIQEKKINIETKNVDLRNSEQMEDWFSKINPRNIVPFLVSKETISFITVFLYVFILSKSSRNKSTWKHKRRKGTNN